MQRLVTRLCAYLCIHCRRQLMLKMCTYRVQSLASASSPEYAEMTASSYFVYSSYIPQSCVQL